jgi:hypothetical protein
MPLLRRLVAGLSPRRPAFATRSVHVGFVVDKVALGQVFLRVLVFPYQYHSTVAFHTCITWGMNNSLVSGRSSETQSQSIDMNNNKR